LRSLGWTEGGNLVLELRLSRPNTDDLEQQAAELARLGLDVIVAAALPQAIAIRRHAPGVPLVIGTGPGLVQNGFAASVERPGGNATGMDELPPGLTGRRLALLKRAAPRVSRVALLSTTPGRGNHETQAADAEARAKELGVTVKPYRATSLAELQGALSAIASDGMNGLVNFQGALSLINRELIVEFAARHAMPAIYQSKLFARSGGLMTWAPDQVAQFRIAARNADRVLRGTPAGEIPIRFPERYFLTINAATARQLGLALPEDLLAEADEVLDNPAGKR
jgi:putative ABC transport system substrate-binding protein